MSVQHVFGTYLSEVAEVEVAKDGSVTVKRVVCAVDCGQVVNPDTVRAQLESGVIFGITAALYGEITLKDGRVEQSNFDNYRMLRIGPGAQDRGVYRRERRSARRHGRARHVRTRAGGGKRHLRRNRQTAAQAAPGCRRLAAERVSEARPGKEL